MDDGEGKNTTARTERLPQEAFATASFHLATGSRCSTLLLFSCDGIQAVPLEEDRPLVVGRDDPADVILRESSLSRSHASVEVTGGEFWVQDLQSTNGTWVNGRRIERARVEESAEIRFGGVAAVLHSPRTSVPWVYDLEHHDRFLSELEIEVCRARATGAGFSMMMLCGRANAPISRWFPRVQELLQPFDRLALYSADTVEILAPGLDEERAIQLARRAVSISDGLCCGLARFPADGSSAGELVGVVRDALARSTQDATQPIATARPSAKGPDHGPTAVIATSDAMIEVMDTARRLATSTIPVLILGETGSGKEVAARHIHDSGKRSSKPMVCVNCGCIPSQLVESTLFGHERGAFTGADRRQKGVFESAEGGTVLLDEVGELPQQAQASLLRVIENKRLTRVGSSQEIAVDVRILAATHRDLEAMCLDDNFRWDLLYRLNGMILRVPPLRDRVEEIEPLAERFIARANQDNDRAIRGMAPGVVPLLQSYLWPGNVRELRNVIERAVVIAQSESITVDDLPRRLRGGGSIASKASVGVAAACAFDFGDGFDLKGTIKKYEASIILDALRSADGDRRRAAKLLGLPVRTLAHKMRTLGVRRPTYETGPPE